MLRSIGKQSMESMESVHKLQNNCSSVITGNKILLVIILEKI